MVFDFSNVMILKGMVFLGWKNSFGNDIGDDSRDSEV